MEDISNYDAIRILRTRTMDEISKINRQIQIIDECIDNARGDLDEAENTYENAKDMAEAADAKVSRLHLLLADFDRQREELANTVADLSITNKNLSELDEKLAFPNLKGVE